ncbi:cytochrome (ubi)quinol oxidase subunit III [Alicyclobacillus sp. ALC3]|uniref:cytochrome (ubi)quinol oxidase subunit III n=1 Tax=Alicyclobacillus sp. ALC3 TaxID=2796143 RepID=UPI00237928F1|nr:cytochrome (ubi)quinol oxidase subunit III [Alicyclobacillus sp. ALC3]WDL96283.1 cytochrome (ubi)quinol oxidase subunit III [Alicyclobacillus sp. ALC3]
MSLAHEAVLHGTEPDDSLPLEYSTEDGALKIFGFWLFLSTDLVLFACLFATYVVLHTHSAGGPTELSLFDVPEFTAETLILLTSSFTCGIATYGMRLNRRGMLVTWLILTIVLGLSFIGLEVNEFTKYATHGAPLQRSAFLSAFFTLVGTHGGHVSMGILWMVSILIQIGQRGITAITARKVFIVGLYWHFLDVVWVFIFTVVYLAGIMNGQGG